MSLKTAKALVSRSPVAAGAGGPSDCVSRERQVRLAGASPAGARARRPVAWIAGWRETETLKPIDKAIRGMVSESPGRNASDASRVRRDFSGVLSRPHDGPPSRAGPSGRAGASSVALQDEREPVRELRHSTKEQAALSREHRACEVAFSQPATRVAEVRDRGGDVPLRR